MPTIGISEVDITPAPGLPTAGMCQPPRTVGVLYPLKARILVFDDGKPRGALVSLDNLGLATSLIPELRQALTAGTNLSPDSVMIGCTHTHSAPITSPLMDTEIDFTYVDLLKERLSDGMRQALNVRQPARIKVGRADAPGWTFNRRQVYRSERYGEQVGTQGPQNVPHFLRNEGPEDNEVQVMLAETPAGEPLGGVINFACHPTLTYGDGKNYSADYPGPLTELLSRRYGGVFAFLQGAAGNLWGVNTGAGSRWDEYGLDHVQKMVTALADKAGQALANGTILEDGHVRMAQKVLRIPQRRPTPEQVALARWYLEKAPPDLDQQEFTRRLYGHDFTFYDNHAFIQEWFARETVSLWEWQRRIGSREIHDDVEIQVIAVGDLAFVGFPAEYFTEFGLRIKAQSPFPATFLVELANGWHGYVPTQEAFAHGGYEPRLAYSSRLVPDAGDRMCETALELLNQLRQDIKISHGN
jgi:neutral ceramidase